MPLCKLKYYLDKKLTSISCSMFVANKRDMVLLCVDTQLPSSDGRLRLLSTSTSVNVRFLPPKKGYNRFELNIGGFLVEDMASPCGKQGIRVTQVSDLGETAAWVPASIIRMVASTMVPKSMSVIAKIASKMKVAEALLQEGSGYGGEEERNQEKDLCELGGGSWQSNRQIPPILTVIDVLQAQRTSQIENPNTSAAASDEPSDASINASSTMATTLESEDSTFSFPSDKVASSSSFMAGDESLDLFNSDAEPIKRSKTPEEEDISHDNTNVEVRGQEEEEEEESEERMNRTSTTEDEVINSEVPPSTQTLSSSPQIFKQMSLPQRKAQKRISAMLIFGSDSLAMAIAPGARESMQVVAQILNTSMDDLDKQQQFKSSSFSANTLGRRIGTSTSKIVLPVMTTTSAEGYLDAHSLTEGYTCSSSGSEGSQSPTTASNWTSSITEAPYTVAMGILSLAAWFATRPSASSVPCVESEVYLEDDAPKQGTELSRPTLSALSVTKQAYLQRDALRMRQNDRPQSHYRVNDSKLHPFPMINNENLPPLGIANGRPTCIMKRAPARVASLQEQQQQQQFQHQSSWWASYF